MIIVSKVTLGINRFSGSGTTSIVSCKATSSSRRTTVLTAGRALAGKLIGSRHDRHSTSSLSLANFGWTSCLSGGASSSLLLFPGQMLFLVVSMDPMNERLPPRVMDIYTFYYFRVVILFSSRWVGNFEVRVILFIISISILNCYSTVKLLLIRIIMVAFEFNPDVMSSEHVFSHIETDNLHHERELIEIDSSVFIDLITMAGNMDWSLNLSLSSLQHPLKLGFVRMGVIFPLVLPPRKLFCSDLNHLIEPSDFIFLSLPVIVHFLKDNSVLALLSDDLSSPLVNQEKLIFEVFSHWFKIFVILLSKVNERFNALNIFFTAENIFLELHVLSDLLHQSLDELDALLDVILVRVDELSEVVLELFDFFRRWAASKLRGDISLTF